MRLKTIILGLSRANIGKRKSRAAKRGCFKRGGFPIWTCPSFFVLFCPFWDFPDFLGFSRFARGWSGDFPDLSFSSFSAYSEHLRGTVPKGSATQYGPFPKKVGNTRVWKPPGLASLKKKPIKTLFLQKGVSMSALSWDGLCFFKEIPSSLRNGPKRLKMGFQGL